MARLYARHAQNYTIRFERRPACTVALTNDDNGELALLPRLETVLGSMVTPWAWEGYTRSARERSRKR
jgi:hypothetical protein